MNTAELKAGFNQAIKNAAASGTVSPDKLAEMELIREYFTNPTFKAGLEQHVWEINSQPKMRTATVSDFSQGNTLYNQYGPWTLIDLAVEGMWNARGVAGVKVVDEGEAEFYQVTQEA